MSRASYDLDTSVVVRLLVQEPRAQYFEAADFLEENLSKGISVFVGDLVLAEAYFALQSYYKIPKAKVLALLAGFVETEGINATSAARQILSLPNLATAKPGFVDRLIHAGSSESGRTLITFEAASGKLPSVIVLKTPG